MGREEDEEDVSGYWIALGKREDNWKLTERALNAVSRELANVLSFEF